MIALITFGWTNFQKIWFHSFPPGDMAAALREQGGSWWKTSHFVLREGRGSSDVVVRIDDPERIRKIWSSLHRSQPSTNGTLAEPMRLELFAQSEEGFRVISIAVDHWGASVASGVPPTGPVSRFSCEGLSDFLTKILHQELEERAKRRRFVPR